MSTNYINTKVLARVPPGKELIVRTLIMPRFLVFFFYFSWRMKKSNSPGSQVLHSALRRAHEKSYGGEVDYFFNIFIFFFFSVKSLGANRSHRQIPPEESVLAGAETTTLLWRISGTGRVGLCLIHRRWRMLLLSLLFALPSHSKYSRWKQNTSRSLAMIFSPLYRKKRNKITSQNDSLP